MSPQVYHPIISKFCVDIITFASKCSLVPLTSYRDTIPQSRMAGTVLEYHSASMSQNASVYSDMHTMF